MTKADPMSERSGAQGAAMRPRGGFCLLVLT
jgi:hypothetical protein